MLCRALFFSVGVLHATVAHAQLLPPRLIALSRPSPATVIPGDKVEFRFSATPGTVATQSLRLALRTPDGSEYRTIRTSDLPSGTASVTVDDSWVNGYYELSIAELVDDGNRTVRYGPDGTVSGGTFANAETSHAFNFATLGVIVSGASPQAAIPEITSLEMLSPATVSPGQSARFRLTGFSGKFPLARLTLTFRHTASANTLTTVAETTEIAGELTLPITADMANGRYRLVSVRFQNQAGDGFVANQANQSMIASFGGVNYSVGNPTSAFAEFTIANASGSIGSPRLTSWTRLGQGDVTPGNLVRFAYETTPVGSASPVQRVQARLTAPYGGSFTYTADTATGTFSIPVTASWITGPYVFSLITVTDAAGRSTSYLPAGGSSLLAPGAIAAIPVPAESFRFEVRATSISPFFILKPAAEISLAANGTAGLTAVGVGLGPVTYQWYRGEPGDTRQPVTSETFGASNQLSSLTVPASAAGIYWVRLASTGATADSSAARVAVVAPAATVAPSIVTQPVAQSVTAGTTATLSVVAAGSPPLTYQWVKDRVTINGATSASYSIASATAGFAGASGVYSVNVTNALGAVKSNDVALAVSPSAWLSNLSVRSTLASAQVLTVGVVVGHGAKTVLVRAAGPALAAFGLTGAMADPRLDLYQGSIRITSNDDWAAPLATTFASLGAFAFSGGSKDAALLQSLTGACSAQVTGTTAGAVLVEGYDAGRGSAVRLVNVSARNRIGTDSDILIAGFTITGTGTLRVLVRAVGPALVSFGVTGVLADPKLELYDANGTKLDENDNWPSILAPTFSSVGAFALLAGSKDAALVTTLFAGKSYTVQVSGVSRTTGDGLVEIYELP